MFARADELYPTDSLESLKDHDGPDPPNLQQSVLAPVFSWLAGVWRAVLVFFKCF